MANPQITGVHFVGSIPLSTTEDAMKTVSSALGGCLRRIPDGETGERYNFTAWQVGKIQSPAFLSELRNPNGKNTFTDEEKDALVQSLPELKTGYDDYALQSYKTFKELKTQGLIAPETRFLVCMPTPLTVTSLVVRKALQDRGERIYEDALLRGIERILSEVPASELAIQWDLPLEIGMLENCGPYGIPVPWFSPVFDGIVDRLARIGSAVDADVELGYHFCYGDLGHKHFKEPTDASIMVKVVDSLLLKCKRHISWIHMPVPKSRSDDAYFAPLKKLGSTLGNTELVLGLVHGDDLEGTRERIHAAGKAVSRFGVASECGLGRTTREEFESIMSISATVARGVNTS